MIRRAVFGLALILSAVAAQAAPPPPMTPAGKQAMEQIMAQLKKLGSDMRSTNPHEYAELLAHDYTEFDPYYPFMLNVPRDDIVALQQVWDTYEKVSPAERATKAVRLQLYGDVAIITTTSYYQGQAIPAGPMAAHKSMIVYVKQGGAWILSHCHDGRVAGADGLPAE